MFRYHSTPVSLIVLFFTILYPRPKMESPPNEKTTNDVVLVVRGEIVI
jgi:hypothetical protein